MIILRCPICGRLPQSHVQIVPHEDAALFAAAPDLLAACEEIVAEFDSGGFHSAAAQSEGVLMCRAALAKARGQA